MAKKIHVVYAIDWTEYERGWGNRPDGTSLHTTKEVADKYLADDIASKKLPVPDVYTSGGKPYLLEVDKKTHERVHKSKTGTTWK